MFGIVGFLKGVFRAKFLENQSYGSNARWVIQTAGWLLKPRFLSFPKESR